MMTLETATAGGVSGLAVLVVVIGALVAGVWGMLYLVLVVFGVGRRTEVQTSGEKTPGDVDG
jgi:hypothetical protein